MDAAANQGAYGLTRAGVKDAMSADLGVVGKAVSGTAPAVRRLVAGVVHEAGVEDLRDPEPHRDVTFAAVVQEGGFQQVEVVNRLVTQTARDFEGVALVTPVHLEEEAGLGGGKHLPRPFEVGMQHARTEGVRHLAGTVRGPSERRHLSHHLSGR